MGRRQYEAAQALIEPLVAKRPADAPLQYALGSLLYMQGHLVEAEARLRESLRLDANQVASPYYLALAARDQGRHARGHRAAFGPAPALSGPRFGVRSPGRAADGRWRQTEAERLLRRAVELNPKSVKANYQLGLLLARTGRKEEADKQLALAKSLREEDDAGSKLQFRLIDPEG